MKFMRKLVMTVVCLAGLLALGPEALAKPTGPGAGVEAMIRGDVTPAGPAFVYDFGRFRLDALFALATDNFAFGGDTNLTFAGRGWFVLHDAGSADFSVGGGLGLGYVDVGNDSNTSFFIELGGQIRAFLVTNVALQGTLGMVIGLGDFEGVAIGGSLVSTFGVTYFF